jgi:hypothetical protein
VTERLLDDDPPPAAIVMLVVKPDPTQLGDDVRELRRLRGEIEQPVALRPALLVDLVEPRGQPVEGSRILEVATLVGHPLREGAPGDLVDRQDAAVLLQRAEDLLPEGLVVVFAPADGHDLELVREQVRPPQLVERRQHLAVGQVAGRAEQHDDRRIRDACEAQAFAQDILGLARLRRPATDPRLAHLAHGERRVLWTRGGPGRDRLVGRGLDRRRILYRRLGRPV